MGFLDFGGESSGESNAGMGGMMKLMFVMVIISTVVGAVGTPLLSAVGFKSSSLLVPAGRAGAGGAQAGGVGGMLGGLMDPIFNILIMFTIMNGLLASGIFGEEDRYGYGSKKTGMSNMFFSIFMISSLRQMVMTGFGMDKLMSLMTTALVMKLVLGKLFDSEAANGGIGVLALLMFLNPGSMMTGAGGEFSLSSMMTPILMMVILSAIGAKMSQNAFSTPSSEPGYKPSEKDAAGMTEKEHEHMDTELRTLAGEEHRIIEEIKKKIDTDIKAAKEKAKQDLKVLGPSDKVADRLMAINKLLSEWVIEEMKYLQGEQTTYQKTDVLFEQLADEYKVIVAAERELTTADVSEAAAKMLESEEIKAGKMVEITTSTKTVAIKEMSEFLKAEMYLEEMGKMLEDYLHAYLNKAEGELKAAVEAVKKKDEEWTKQARMRKNIALNLRDSAPSEIKLGKAFARVRKK